MHSRIDSATLDEDADFDKQPKNCGRNLGSSVGI